MAISDAVISQAAQRIADHATAHGLGTVQVVLHGGEPLLAGRARLRRVATELHAALRGVCHLDLRIHTNGVLLDEGFCDLFAEHGVKVGISIDGDRAANDRHRRYADGRSSYEKVIQAITLLRTGRFQDLYAGLLCTIDLTNDPLVVYESLMDLHPPRVDFLLPHATWDHRPPRTRAADSEYADWLIAIYDRWIAEGRPARIRTFDSIVSTLRGRESFTEALGLEPIGLAVIETDGSYEQVDSLKAAFDGAPETGTNVFDHALDVVAQHPGILARQQGMAGLCQTCQECPVVTSCGGGLYTHRYREANGFANPSVYCADLLKLITHISSHLPEEPAGVPGRPAHVMTGQDFQALAAGFGDAAAVTQLIEAQRSLVRALLGAVYQAATATPEVPAAVKAQLQAAWSLLTTLDREQPKALDAVLGHPYIRHWAIRCQEQLRPASVWPGDDDQIRDARGLAADLGHLGAIAAAAAAAAGVSATVRIPLMDGAVHLPTLGRLAVGPGQADSPGRADGPDEAARPLGEVPEATVDVTGDVVAIRIGESCWTLARTDLLSGGACPVATDEDGRSADWQPVRRLRAPGIVVALDDTDPYRDCYQWRAGPRLTEAEFAQWQRHFQDAWQEIGREHAAYAPALAAGLTTLIPLAAPQEDRDVSGAARDAFGAVAVALPADPVALALLLIHEFQHVKLGAVLDLYDLYDQADDRLFHPPWGGGEGSLESLLQGAYSHLAVTDFWRVRQSITGRPGSRGGRGAIHALARSYPRSDRDPGQFWLVDAARDVVRR